MKRREGGHKGVVVVSRYASRGSMAYRTWSSQHRHGQSYLRRMALAQLTG